MNRRLRTAYHAARFFLLRRAVPLEMNIHITDRCQRACAYCYGDFHRTRRPDLPLAVLRDWVDAFYRAGTVEFSLIGGEPLLHPHYDDLVAHIAQYPVSISSVTNGFLVRQHLPALRKLKMVCVSVDGDRASNDAVRGEGAYDAAVDALAALQEAGIPRALRATLTRANRHALPHLAALAERFGALINFGLLFPQGPIDRKLPSELTDGDADYQARLRDIIALKRQHPRLLFNSLVTLETALAWPTTYTKYFIERHEAAGFGSWRPQPCSGGRAYATIDTDGKIYPCTMRMGAYAAPDCFADGPVAAWAQLADHPCCGCFYLSSIEKNLVTHFVPDAVRNLLTVKRV